jgi:cell division protein FtsL
MLEGKQEEKRELNIVEDEEKIVERKLQEITNIEKKRTIIKAVIIILLIILLVAIM